MASSALNFYEMWLLLPRGTDVRSNVNAPLPDVAEVPAGSKRFYDVVAVDDVSKGFPSEYRVARLEQSQPAGAWPAPMP
jgi:hypothetical protein